MNMNHWLQTAPSKHKAMPILSFPGVQLMGASVDSLVRSGKLQADCMKSIADRYDILASVSLMDLSVEAEAFGSPVRFSDSEVPTVTAPIINTDEDCEKLRVPHVGDGRTGEYVKTIEYAKGLITHVPILAGAIGPFSLSGRLMDMTEIMVKCYSEEELVHATLQKATDFLIEYNLALKAAGANGLIIAEPAAGLLSPSLIAEFSTPYVNQIIKAVESEDFCVIYHNCGKTIPLIESILNTGARALHFGNAIALDQMLPLVPSDRVVFGNVEPAGEFRNGTPESVRKATLDVLNKCSKYPNFIISSGCDIPPMSPLANIDSFFATVEEFYK